MPEDLLRHSSHKADKATQKKKKDAKWQSIYFQQKLKTNNTHALPSACTYECLDSSVNVLLCLTEVGIGQNKPMCFSLKTRLDVCE